MGTSSGPNTVRRLPRRLRTAASVTDRAAAVASFHGGGLATDQPNSHLQAAKSKAPNNTAAVQLWRIVLLMPSPREFLRLTSPDVPAPWYEHAAN